MPTPDPLADLGALLGPIVHETSNFLNVLLLNAAVLEPAVAPESRGELEEIRREGVKLGALLRLLQMKRSHTLAGEPVDLVQIVPGVPVLAASPLLVPGPANEVDRLVRFLMRAAESEPARLRRKNETAVIEFDCGNDAARRITSHAIDPEFEFALESAACQAIVRRRGGSMTADGGTLAVTLPLSSTNDAPG